ncbi:hypothetical protein LOAG_17708 [Loa loa]|uniref:Uncharacterized protein n=1 Tax=Loa loa TaxID=7209 RepID=A0A1S0UH91_LOALO|nr:hypothetical protein LOAG_17708 [Loa loa]EJD75072.1 hypothetical protein LOAG_17708 [Loa loa]
MTYTTKVHYVTSSSNSSSSSSSSNDDADDSSSSSIWMSIINMNSQGRKGGRGKGEVDQVEWSFTVEQLRINYLIYS